MADNVNVVAQIMRALEAMIRVLQKLITPVQSMESELPKLQPKHDEEEEEAEKIGCSQRPELGHQSEGGDSVEGFCETPPPQYNHRQTQPDDVIRQQNREEEFGSKVKVDIPVYNGNLNLEELCEWIMDVERYFELYEIPENEQVELVANRFEEGVLAWWEELQNHRLRTGKQPIHEWPEMEKMLRDRFFALDYDRFIFKQLYAYF